MPDTFIVTSATVALPSAASGTVNTAAIQVSTVQATGGGEMDGNHTFVLSAPALTTTMLPNGETATYAVQSSTTSGFGSATTVIPVVAKQTGAGGAGAAAQTVYFRVPYNCQQFVRVSCTLSSGATDSHTVSMTLSFNK